MKKSAIKRIISLALAIVMFALFTTNSLAVGNDTAVEDSIAVPIMQAKEGEAIDKYNALLKAWAGGSEVYHDGNIVYPDYYGGTYIDENKNLVISVTSTDKSVLAGFANIIDIKNVIFQEVEYSYSTLIAERNNIAKIMLESNRSGVASTITGVGISPKHNSVNLYSSIPKDSPESVTNQVKQSVSSFENIIIIPDHHEDIPVDTIQPGSYIKSQAIGGWKARSVGFWARNSSGDLGFVTAPHGTISYNTAIYNSANTVIGMAETPYYSGSVDAVFVRRINSDFSASRTLANSNISFASGTYIILPVGATTYSSGQKSNYQTGVVGDISYVTSYGIYNAVLTSALCQEGDSGGPVVGYSNTNYRYELAGIITGSTSGDNFQIYCKAGNIVSALGISIY